MPHALVWDGDIPDRGVFPVSGDYRRQQHRGLVLIGTKGVERLTPDIAARLARRLLSPAALVEGVDLHLLDPGLHDEMAQATGFALTLPPVGNFSNPFYSVHSRRNDRFLAARAPLRALFPNTDFTEFAFTGHMLGALASSHPGRFAELRTLLQQAWAQRMAELLRRLPPRGVVLDFRQPNCLPRPRLAPPGVTPVIIDAGNRGVAGRLVFDALAGVPNWKRPA